MTVPIERLREVLKYDPDSGEIRWLKNFQSRYIGKVAGSMSKGYLRITVDGEAMFAHRIAWAMHHGRWPAIVDHINCDRSDNRISNLREASHAQNMQNRVKAKCDNASGLLGVKRNGRGWQARIQLDKKLMALGTFPTPEEAYAAYVSAKRRLHEFNTL